MNYKRLGRKHARQALKKFFADQESLVEECTDAQGVCKECLTNKAVEIFFDLQLKESMDPESKFRPPSDEESEQLYHDSAMDLISRTIERSAPHRAGAITNPEDAYDTGCEIMGDVVQEVLGDLLPEDYEDDIKKTIMERCWAVLEEKAGDEIPLPKIHGGVKEYYDRGIHDTLTAVEPPDKPESPMMALDFPRRVARYEKLLMGMH